MKNTPKKLLIVDDNPLALKIGTYLLKATYDIETASNGEMAVDQAMKQRFDVILMDINMPIMDGLTATKILRKTYANLPIIGISAQASNDMKAKAQSAGMNTLLRKPITEGALSQALENLLGASA
jgi:CheY-like chemotaxis protein